MDIELVMICFSFKLKKCGNKPSSTKKGGTNSII